MDLATAVVLAAGEGSRLRPLTEYRPKPMLPAANKPILEHVLDALINAGIHDLHVVVGYGRDRVQSYFGSTHRDRPITYHVQETRLGSGHAVLQAASAITEDVIVTNGDEVVTPGFIEAVVSAHSTEQIATLGVIESKRATQFGAVELDGDQVTNLVESPRESAYRLMNAGVYAFGPSIVGEIEATPQIEGERALTATIERLIDRSGNVRGVRTAEPRTEVTYPWDLLALNAELLDSGAVGGLPPRSNGVYVAETASVAEAATLVPPVAVGPDAVVEPEAAVGPAVSVGRNTTVEAGATLDRTIVEANSRIGRNTTLTDTISGVGTNHGPSVTIPGGPASVRVGETMYDDEPLGAVVADRTSTGGGTTIAPGTLIGPDADIGVGAHVAGDIAKETEVRR